MSSEHHLLFNRGNKQWVVVLVAHLREEVDVMTLGGDMTVNLKTSLAKIS